MKKARILGYRWKISRDRKIRGGRFKHPRKKKMVPIISKDK